MGIGFELRWGSPKTTAPSTAPSCFFPPTQSFSSSTARCQPTHASCRREWLLASCWMQLGQVSSSTARCRSTHASCRRALSQRLQTALSFFQASVQPSVLLYSSSDARYIKTCMPPLSVASPSSSGASLYPWLPAEVCNIHIPMQPVDERFFVISGSIKFDVSSISIHN